MAHLAKRNSYSIAALRARARAVLPQPIFDFADGGAEEEKTLTQNEQAFTDYDFLPRPLNGTITRDLSVDLFGHKLSFPLVLGPTGLSGLFWPGGEQATANAAKKAGIGYCLSHGSLCTLEDLAQTGVRPRFMQIFVYKDRGFSKELIERARQSAYDGLVVTVDNQLLGQRERDIRNGFVIPPQFSAADKIKMATKLEWLLRMRKELKTMTFGNYVKPDEPGDIASLAGKMSNLLDTTMSWDDIEWIRKDWSGPLIIKGIMHPEDAKRAIDYGVDSIIVSNHGGRQLDSAAATLQALPRIADVVERRIPIMIDGGIRRGSDMVKALALGATACWIGRPHLWGVAVAGQEGVDHAIEILRTEFDRTLGLCGIDSIANISSDYIVKNR